MALLVVGLSGAVLLVSMLMVAVGGYRLEPVLSGSMRPHIQPGSLAVLKPVPIGQLRVGNVIAYLPPDHATPVMHRIVSISAEGIATKGDANPVADPWGPVAPAGTKVYRLVAVVPEAGFLAGVRSEVMASIGAALLLLLLAITWVGGRKPDVPDDSGLPPRKHGHQHEGNETCS